MRKTRIATCAMTLMLAASTLSLSGVAHAGFFDRGRSAELTAEEASEVHHARALRRLDRMADALDLSDEQRTAIEAAFEASHEGMAALRDSKKALREELSGLSFSQEDSLRAAEIAAELGALTEQKINQKRSMMAQIFNLLTPEQQEKMTELKQQLGARRGGFRGQRWH